MPPLVSPLERVTRRHYRRAPGTENPGVGSSILPLSTNPSQHFPHRSTPVDGRLWSILCPSGALGTPAQTRSTFSHLLTYREADGEGDRFDGTLALPGGTSPPAELRPPRSCSHRTYEGGARNGCHQTVRSIVSGVATVPSVTLPTRCVRMAVPSTVAGIVPGTPHTPRSPTENPEEPDFQSAGAAFGFAHFPRRRPTIDLRFSEPCRAIAPRRARQRGGRQPASRSTSPGRARPCPVRQANPPRLVQSRTGSTGRSGRPTRSRRSLRSGRRTTEARRRSPWRGRRSRCRSSGWAFLWRGGRRRFARTGPRWSA